VTDSGLVVIAQTDGLERLVDSERAIA
jgi:hypothetical protein